MEQIHPPPRPFFFPLCIPQNLLFRAGEHPGMEWDIVEEATIQRKNGHKSPFFHCSSSTNRPSELTQGEQISADSNLLPAASLTASLFLMVGGGSSQKTAREGREICDQWVVL